MEDSCFAFLHEVQCDTNVNKFWLYLLMTFNFVQLLSFPLSPSPVMPWAVQGLMRSVYIILAPITFSPSTATSPTFSFILFCVFGAWAALLMLCIAWGVWLWSSDALGGGYRPMWLPRLVRITARLNNLALIVPVVSSLLAPLACAAGAGTQATCGEKSFALVVGGGVLAPLYVVASMGVALLLVQRKPSARNLLAAPHGRFLAAEVLVKAVLCVVFSFARVLSAWVVIVAAAVGSCVLLLLAFRFLPYYSKHLNSLLCGQVRRRARARAAAPPSKP
jgi:hypothetical protein